MSYKKAEELLPTELIELIQQYVDGESIYIPRKKGTRQDWGNKTTTRQELHIRHAQIYRKYQHKTTTATLASLYFLSEKSIQRIIRTQRNILNSKNV